MGIELFLTKDYLNSYTDEVLVLKKRILKPHSKVRGIFMRRKYNRLLFKCQSFLPLSEAISDKITFPHGLSGIFISGGAKIGDNCTIFQQVTIGSNTLNDSKTKGYPVIGKNCYIGAGAKIIGNVKVGDNVRIGANAVVVKDVPDNATVVGGRPRIIEHDHKLDNGFVKFKGGNK